ncbi:putative Small heat shock protein C4 [Candidatus Nitrosotenuis uzonensis]|nr:putative Small heat shock protein C4 [Candidatus Nitrosotenuis uzonensis]
MILKINWIDDDFLHLPILQFGDDLEQKILSPLSYIREHESKWVLEFDLPLVEKKDIAVSIDSNETLVVEAKLKEVYTDSKGGRQYQFEYFKKSLPIPKNVDVEEISARFSDGRLTITMPKSFQGNPINIE